MYEVVVAIDFGSSGTGYAYSYNNPDNIILGKFPFQNTEVKVPTQIILDSSLKKILAFGEKCDSYIDGHQLTNGELYFKKIKMNLYYNKRDIMPENDLKTYPLVEVISKIFEYIKFEVLKAIHNNRPNILENQIKWVVTVPAIWNLSQKGIMISASEKAGLFNQYTDRTTFLAIEPEAASFYCSKDSSIDQNYIMPGKSYIICDLGGGTGDIVTHHKNINNEISEKYQPIGGPYGSDEIDRDIFDIVINKLFGFKDFNSLKEKYNYLKNIKKFKELSWNEDELYIEWKKFKEDIQKQKKITEDLKNQSFFLNCQIFEDFINDIELKDLVNNFNNSCKEGWKIDIKNEKRWILNFPYKIFFDLIEAHASKIAEQIDEIYKKTVDVESILYVGGYCSNEVLINNLKNKFKNLAHLKPSHPEIAVVKGAVLFGLNPNLINIRKAMYTIGFNCDDNWNDQLHSGIGEKYYDYNYNIYKCRNSFHTIIKKGQDIPQNNVITKYFTTMNPRIIILKFFKSEKENPVLWTENGVKLIGNEQLDLSNDYPLGQRDFIINIRFGGTYADAKCTHYLSGKTLNFPLYFNN